MRRPVLLLLLLPGFATAAFAEDAAHRADRLYTEQLNHRAMAAATGWERANDRSLDRYRDARARYERQRAEWQQRFAACEDGYWRACD